MCVKFNLRTCLCAISDSLGAKVRVAGNCQCNMQILSDTQCVELRRRCFVIVGEESQALSAATATGHRNEKRRSCSRNETVRLTTCESYHIRQQQCIGAVELNWIELNEPMAQSCAAPLA